MSRSLVPLLSVAVQSETKILLDTLAALLQTSTGRVIEILVATYVKQLPESERAVVEELKDAAIKRTTGEAHVLLAVDTGPVRTYNFSRLCFKREVIESLGANDCFRVDTPTGSFQMKKADFYRVFPNVVASISYRENGMYHYRSVPRQAEEFRIE
jgi:hypothetical protein